MQLSLPRTYKLALIAALLAGCGGGGDGGSTITNPDQGGGPGPNPGPGNGNDIVLTAACTDDSFLCSGRTILDVNNGVAMTDNAVQVYGLSTSDLDRATNPNHTVAEGLMLPDCTSPANCGVAEVRKQRTENGRLVLLLDKIGLSWDRGRSERPMIIDTFSTVMGRAEIDGNNVVRFSTDLPLSSNTDFYDWSVRGASGTQAHYANNVYFPRSAPPVRCPLGENGEPIACPDTESAGVRFTPAGEGSWRSGGLMPDMARASRLHGEGDLRAGDQPNGQPIEDNDGFGPSYPGFKGYRTLTNRSYRYANLGTWLTSDTVNIVEWVTDNLTPYEHAKFRYGMVAYGEVTPSAAVPASGTSTYRGVVHGLYASSRTALDTEFMADLVVEVNFATGAATVRVIDARTHDSEGSRISLPGINFASATALGASGLRNYSAGAVAPTSSGMTGGVSTRLFGPGAEEMGGTFAIDNEMTGETVIAGFLALRR